jgi:hypothetical protein
VRRLEAFDFVHELQVEVAQAVVLLAPQHNSLSPAHDPSEMLPAETMTMRIIASLAPIATQSPPEDKQRDVFELLVSVHESLLRVLDSGSEGGDAN